MDFLTTALYSPKGDAEEALVGVLLTHYDVDSKVTRPVVYYADVDELHRMQGRFGEIIPRGFALDASGVLMSDTICRSVFDDSVTMYIEKEAPSRKTGSWGLIDFVLDAISNGIVILQNYEAITAGNETEMNFVSFDTLRVSRSSFNIYTPYRNAKDEFRTLSLIDIQTDKSIPFYAVIPADCSDMKQKYENFMECVSLPEGIELAEGSNVYRVEIPLLPAHCYMGEAFVNYLAYNVAYYTFGEKVMDSFLEDNKFIPAADAVQLNVEAPKRTKRPRHNVRIEHEFRDTNLRQLLECMGNRDAMSQLLTIRPETWMTLDWVQTVFRNKPEDCDWNSDAMCQSCLRLKYSCREELLRYSLELLAQRYYVCQAGFIDDTLPDILKGGGVSGCSIKRVTW